MTNKSDTHKIGDTCLYSFGEKNKSRAIVEIVDLKENSGRVCAKIRFQKVMVDDTGNGMFNYLQKTGETMFASLEYLHLLPRLTVAIDGPAAAGKTTLAKRLAERFGITYIDTGAMFRAVALHALRMERRKRGISNWIIRDLSPGLIDEVLNTIDLEVECEGPVQTIYLDAKPVTDEELRTSTISILASNISTFAKVRAFLLDKQRAIAANADVVMEGRDIGSVVLPNALCKFYLDADLLVRAQRRYTDLRKTNLDIDPLKVASDLAVRDRQDSTRKEAPLHISEGSLMINSTEMNADAVCEEAARIIEAKLAERNEI